MPRDVLSSIGGIEFSTPSQAWEWLESQRNLTDREKRRVSELISQWETHVGHTLAERANSRTAQIKELKTKNRERMEAGHRRTAEIEHAMRTGRMDPETGLAELGRLQREHEQCVAVQRSLRNASESWDEDTDRTVGDYLVEMGRRFPSASAAYRLRLTPAYLAGEESSPFIGGRS